MIRACMVDMDGTLLDSMPYWQMAEAEIFAQAGIALPAEARERLLLQDSPEQVTAWFSQDRDTLWERYADAMAGHYARSVPAKPGAAAFLQAAKAKGILRWMVTMSRLEQAEQAIQRCGLAGDFERMMSTRYQALHKYNPAFFAWMAGEMGVLPGELAVVEDSLGICKCAKAAGCIVFGIEEPIHHNAAEMRAVCDLTAPDFISLAQAL